MRTEKPGADTLVPLRAAARRLGLDHRILRAAIGRGELAAFRIGTRLRLHLRDVNEWLENQRVATTSSGRDEMR